MNATTDISTSAKESGMDHLFSKRARFEKRIAHGAIEQKPPILRLSRA